jgi:hypothetical protein
MSSFLLRSSCAFVALSAVVAGCGSSSTSTTKPAKTLSISVENFGGETQVKVPSGVEAGVTQMKFTNGAQGTHSAQLVRYDQGHDVQQALKAGNAWGNGGKPLPAWLHLAGGFGTVKAGQSATATLKLDPGSYAVLDLEAKGKPVYGTFNATGKASGDQVPGAAATIRAAEYAFTTSGFKPGANEVEFEDQGKQPHMFAIAPIAAGKSIDDVRSYAKNQKGPSPVEDSKAVDAAVLDSGGKQTLTLNLKAGKYALLCFVPDRQGGPPHVVKGMVSELDVK